MVRIQMASPETEKVVGITVKETLFTVKLNQPIEFAAVSELLHEVADKLGFEITQLSFGKKYKTFPNEGSTNAA